MMKLPSLTTTWTTTYAAACNPATVTSTAVSVKNGARAAFEAGLRPVLRPIQADPTTTDEWRTALKRHLPSGLELVAAILNKKRIAFVC